MQKNWKDVRVLVIGAARQGLAQARYLSSQGAIVTLNDKQPLEKLSKVAQEMIAINVKCIFGDHPLDLLEKTDVLSLSGGIPLELPIVDEAIKKNIPLTNDSQIFMEAVKARVIGITGSAGKTTTTALLGQIATIDAKSPKKAWIGGNIGFPLVEHLSEIKQGDDVILELSSFQLELMTISPKISAVLNITPNHLDRHGSMESYTAAKSRILIHQGKEDIAVLNREDAGSWGLAKFVKGRLLTFGLNKTDEYDGTFLDGQAIKIRDANNEYLVMERDQIRLKGIHNLVNVLAACAISHAAGYSIDSIRQGIIEFTGVPHRLEFVRNWHGADWYNDSIATAPERTIADIQSFSDPLVVMLGGRDKNLPWEKLAELIKRRVDHVVIFGEAREKILLALEPFEGGQRPYTVMMCEKMKDAVLAASEIVETGDVVLFSPGGTSFDEFKDFEERGERYREWVNQL